MRVLRLDYGCQLNVWVLRAEWRTSLCTVFLKLVRGGRGLLKLKAEGIFIYVSRRL